LSESEPEVPFEEPEPDESTPDAPPEEVPPNVDPNTGEVLDPVEPAADDAAAQAENERRAEIAAERQAQEKLMKSLNKAAENYAKRIVDILGGDLTGWQACPLCAEGLPGFRVPRMPDPEYLAQVKIAIGEDPDPALEPDPYSRQCETCKGKGRVDMHSDVPQWKRAGCIPCDGRGWIPVGPERESGRITTGNGVTELAPVVLQDNASNDPPEVAMLKQLGYVVVAPVQTIEPPPFGGV
jgi:hypothetical protein